MSIIARVIQQASDKIKADSKNEPEFLTISNEDHWSDQISLLDELETSLTNEIRTDLQARIAINRDISTQKKYPPEDRMLAVIRADMIEDMLEELVGKGDKSK